jgi:hypothetical protein
VTVLNRSPAASGAAGAVDSGCACVAPADDPAPGLVATGSGVTRAATGAADPEPGTEQPATAATAAPTTTASRTRRPMPRRYGPPRTAGQPAEAGAKNILGAATTSAG